METNNYPTMNGLVKFTKLRSTMDPGFWAKLSELKLDSLKLNDQIKIPLWASYNLDRQSDRQGRTLKLDCTSFNENVEMTSHRSVVTCSGFLINTNTYESFREIKPEKFISEASVSLLRSIKDGSAVREPCRLAFFILLSFADLKRYRFHYWTAHPTSFNLPELYHVCNPLSAGSQLSPDQLAQLTRSFLALDSKQKAFFTVLVPGSDNLHVEHLSKGVDLFEKKATADVSVEQCEEEIYFGFYDPCNSPEPGWPLRNLICLLFWHCPKASFNSVIKIVAMRGPDAKDAVIFTMKAKEYENKMETREIIFEGRFVGWERSHNGKMGPNIIDLSNSMDIVKLSERAVNLNLKLMKWRLVPDLNLEKINKTRCLLLGAGTLGCSVARVLLGWGVQKLTLVDGSTVSQSNPVRQSLYTHTDAVERRYKAEAAKDALLRIHPSLDVESAILQIPMPGHVVGPSMMDATRSAAKFLEELVTRHDVIFLLLDSREARWLPTLLAAVHGKLVINAALGFDSYTVQRHGTRDNVRPDSPDFTMHNPAGADLGCYFCNDITQPGNSQMDRTLDQQCTVSRPGLAQVAGGLAVELMVSLTQHPEYAEARALIADDRSEPHSDVEHGGGGLLGGVPHTIRGSLWNYETHLTVTHRFPACTACSTPLINEFRKKGFDVILNACNEPNYLEHLTGLNDLLKRPDLDELCFAIDSSSEDENEEPGHPTHK
ncbi:ubiquitin-like modifier-activating enzyme ATG7 [Neodiprion fabricii]|uniref:ubiquitin-like modifier-activating enzyme ATG7 n=1 Tax=Neodiprion fabricii TaxID=2872261 RepID=UPI001ED90D95|nr:ubiquitin-like modifier-activating enzyme ATG7 [Neodiprion fabricii]XP_046424104.1 ubiquitin-like modifier-activating enzyme ATG7 [Neodiprion fabricii]